MIKMRKLFIIILLIIGLAACENQGVKFPNYQYNAAYFPYQYPIRTLVLGDDIYPNENDNNHKFLISAIMGGVYENTENRIIEFEVANELCSNVLFASTGDTIRLLPSEYFTLSSPNQLIIPAGEFSGNIEVHLSESFF